MNLQEQLKHAEEMWRAALDKNELYDVMYWRGMVDGLKVRIEREGGCGMTTAERIKTARKEAGITQDELASKMYVTHHCISMWERGLRQPKYETLSRIADALGINVNRLLQTPMTNADKIRAMSDEKLLKVFNVAMNACPPDTEDDRWCDADDDCERCWLEWLKQPVEEDA